MKAFSVGMSPISSLIAFKSNGGPVTIGRVNQNQNELCSLIFTSNDPPPVGRKEQKKPIKAGREKPIHGWIIGTLCGGSSAQSNPEARSDI
jgi:hypothetical protein